MVGLLWQEDLQNPELNKVVMVGQVKECPQLGSALYQAAGMNVSLLQSISSPMFK